MPESKDPITFDAVLLWLGLALGAGVVSRALGAVLPESAYVSPTSYTIMIATVLGLVVAHTPLARFPGASKIASALLIFVVAILASQSNFEGIGSAPWYLRVRPVDPADPRGATGAARQTLPLRSVPVRHLLARPCGRGGRHARTRSVVFPCLVPVGILLALLGYILGTGFGLVMAQVLASLAP